MPSDDSETEQEHYPITTLDLQLLASYTNMDFAQLYELDCVTYKILLRDAYVYKLSQTEDGKNYLDDCWTLQQTQPDIDNLRKQFKRE